MLRIARITVTAALGCGAGAGSQVSICPANAVPEITHDKVSAARNRFMVVAPFFEVRKTMQEFLHQRE